MICLLYPFVYLVLINCNDLSAINRTLVANSFASVVRLICIWVKKRPLPSGLCVSRTLFAWIKTLKLWDSLTSRIMFSIQRFQQVGTWLNQLIRKFLIALQFYNILGICQARCCGYVWISCERNCLTRN
jgi:hypothetical protein